MGTAEYVEQFFDTIDDRGRFSEEIEESLPSDLG